MIALLRGTLIEKHPNQAILDAGGVGYDVTIPDFHLLQLPEPGAEVRLRIHTHVREDMLALYGFLTQDEKDAVRKADRRERHRAGAGRSKCFAAWPAADLINAIRRGEVERLVRIPGVGKKTAERMVLELRDKLPAPAGETTRRAPPALSRHR